MSNDSRWTKRIYASAIAVGLAVGSMGIAGAATGGTTAPVAPTDDAIEVQDPSYTGSVQAPDDETLSEADGAAQLEGLATITPDDAALAASESVAGTVGKVELDNENGSVVYSVEITDDTGAEIDVKVDAGDGTILDQQADNDTDEADEADDDDVQHEHEGENDPDEDHED